MERATRPCAEAQADWKRGGHGAIANETGHTPEETHAWAKAKFLPKKFAKMLGEDVELSPTTATLSKLEFGELLDRIAAEAGVPLPDPQAAGYVANY